ncbi:thiamine-phosphate diphosphorylase [Bowdeniella nasicola]|uniref:Thiamine-phosphate synthase n=1 Tax=Bowdeniella nasicola TaxID=208480 RepID=A0A1Q5PZV8_9ACTO|nr:thiamine phosphate synthase [Bowdeniella nasicola]OKL52959.1 thiamine-phosphate diphosphorylase [Bowdeniella nasicola]
MKPSRSRSDVDWRCYLVTSGFGRETVEKAAAAAAAGAGVVQVRLKDATTRELLAFTIEVATSVAAVAPSTRVLVDDRADVAFAAMHTGHPVHGVHLGWDDLPAAEARAMLGPDAIIGLTTGTLPLVEAADELADIIDYVGCGPFRRTPTKDSGREPLGVEGYPPLVAATSLPLVAIGDVTPNDVPGLAEAGVAGVALVRAIMDAPDPSSVVQQVLAGFRH